MPRDVKLRLGDLNPNLRVYDCDKPGPKLAPCQSGEVSFLDRAGTRSDARLWWISNYLTERFPASVWDPVSSGLGRCVRICFAVPSVDASDALTTFDNFRWNISCFIFSYPTSLSSRPHSFILLMLLEHGLAFVSWPDFLNCQQLILKISLAHLR